jgi:ABC-type glycerol-3-phosphate transport system permease component
MEAARTDGATELQIFRRIILPTMRIPISSWP